VLAQGLGWVPAPVSVLESVWALELAQALVSVLVLERVQVPALAHNQSPLTYR